MRNQPGQIIMTKTLTIILLFVATNIFGQAFSGGLRVTVQEKTKNPDSFYVPINVPVTIILNDSLKYDLTTDSEGSVALKNLAVGKYSVKTVRKDCEVYEIKGILIGEGKTAYMSVRLTCADYIKSLTKKEKKKLGYK